MNSSNTTSFVARVVGLLVMLPATLICLGIMGIGLVLCKMFGGFFIEFADTYRWPRVPCEIVSSVVREANSPSPKGRTPRLDVQVRYEFRGLAYATNLWAGGGSDYSALDRAKQRYVAGSWSACYVNPTPPHQVILRRESLWAGLFLSAGGLFALCFAALGGFGTYAFIRASVFLITTPRLPQTASPPPQWVAGAIGRWFPRLVFGGLLLMGALFLYFLALRPMGQMWNARHWVQTPCVVLSSGLAAKDSAKGRTSYGVNIVYGYEVAGQRYRANRYSFADVASDSTTSHEAVARRYSPGTTNVCYVHPRDPTQVVLERGFTADLWWALLPFAGMLVAAFGWSAVRHRRS